MATNAQGVFLCYRHAALKMVEQGRGGRIIGTLGIRQAPSSNPSPLYPIVAGASFITGKVGDKAGFAYTASKFAIRGMTQSAGAAHAFIESVDNFYLYRSCLALELAKHNITVNAYAPSPLGDTDMGMRASNSS